MAVIDIPALMEMSRQDELMRMRQAEAQRAAAQEQEPDVDFTFEKNGLKVKGKLKDLPRLSQDPILGPYVQGVGQSLQEDQTIDSEERTARLGEIQSKITDIRNKKFKQELEMAQGDLRTGLFNLQLRKNIVSDLEQQEGKLREMAAELSFDRQAGRMDQMAGTQARQEAPIAETAPSTAPVSPITTQVAPTAVAPVTAQEEIPSFNSAAQARAAGIQAGQTVIIRGQRGTLQPKRTTQPAVQPAR